MLLAFWVLAAVFTLITFVWKISLHAGVLSAAATFAIYVFGSSWMWMWGLLLPVSWARVVMKKHTLAQVVAGIVLAPVLLLAMFSMLHISPNAARAPSQTDPATALQQLGITL
jgi:membrane-associated phospholipid phosphatase